MKRQYKVRINYKSGIQEEFWCKAFEIKGGQYSWTYVDKRMNPIKIGVEEIESVWQVGIRYRLW